MKYKLIVLGICVFLLGIGIFVSIPPNSQAGRVHQHILAQTQGEQNPQSPQNSQNLQGQPERHYTTAEEIRTAIAQNRASVNLDLTENDLAGAENTPVQIARPDFYEAINLDLQIDSRVGMVPKRQLRALYAEGFRLGRTVHTSEIVALKNVEEIETGAKLREFSTHLPLVCIDTENQLIPGRAVIDENNRGIIMLTERGMTSISASMSVIDNEDGCNTSTDEPKIESEIDIRVRGNSSRYFDKSNYAIRLLNPDGTNNAQPMLGMGAHHEWVLHGPFLDKSLIRNYVFYNMAGSIMDYAPNVRFCELMLNGEYRGLYLMTESITNGEDGARLDLTVNSRNNRFSGYLLRLDRREVDDSSIAPFSMFTHRAFVTQGMSIQYPGASNLTQDMRKSIEHEFSMFEKALYSFDYDDRRHGWKVHIDEKSFMDYFIINEFLCNYDAGTYSTYIYKEAGNDRYKLCVWDMNSAADNYAEDDFSDATGFRLQGGLWFDMLFKDEDFVEDLIDRYWQLRKSYLDAEYLSAYMDDTVAYLGEAVDRNWAVWDYTFDQKMLDPATRDIHTYEEAISQMKEFLAKRQAWMDENIEILRQHAASSKTKKYNENPR